MKDIIMKMKQPELLSPAGDFEKLRAAVHYGADAIYLSGNDFGMRAASSNFTNEELEEAVRYCHDRGKKVYVTVNVMPRTSQYSDLEKYLKFLYSAGVDAAIISDIGVFTLAREIVPGLEIHISTQASAVSAAAVNAWHKMGARRIVLARELTLGEIMEIRGAIPDSAELECFIHGSMCVAYSGRCLLSQYFLGRDANQGRCAQPCRWIYNKAPESVQTCGFDKYSGSDGDLTDEEMLNKENAPCSDQSAGLHNCMSVSFAEEKRPDEVFTAEGDKNGTYIMSSRDMCMIEHIPELMESGITSFKIEGRVRSAYYTAVVTNAYRMAMDSYSADPASYKFNPELSKELDSVSHRKYGTGFFFGSPMEDPALVEQAGYIREKAYLAVAEEDSRPDGKVLLRQRNKITAKSSAEIISPGKTGQRADNLMLYSPDGEAIDSAPHPNMLFYADIPFSVKKGDILRGAD